MRIPRSSRPSSLARSARAAAVAACVGAALAVPTPAHAAAAPPSLSVPQWPAFAVGSQIGAASYVEDDIITSVKQVLRWSAEDPSGICGSEVARQLAGGGESVVRPMGTGTSYSYLADDGDGVFGGGSFDTWQHVVTAHSCAGGAASAGAWDRFVVTQEDGLGQFGASWVGAPAYTGAWSRVTAKAASAGARQTTSAPGAAMRFTATYERGQHLALVMTKGPSRGKARVLVDGRLVRTVDTAAASVQERVVVFDSWMGAGTHTVEVVNEATEGRPRIDVDAVLTSS